MMLNHIGDMLTLQQSTMSSGVQVVRSSSRDRTCPATDFRSKHRDASRPIVSKRAGTQEDGGANVSWR
jgi:hypothetical protein